MFGYAMQATAVRITRLKMVSTVHKPAPTNGLPATTNTNGVAATKSPVVGGEKLAGAVQRKADMPGKIVKRVHRNGIVNGNSTEHSCRHITPSPPPPSKARARVAPATVPTLPTRNKAPPPPQQPPTATTLTSNQTKTRGAHSNEQGSSTSLGDQSRHRRLVCPELAINYTGTLMSNRAGHLVSSQRDLELRFSTVSRKLREKQLRGVFSHTRKQLHFQDKTTSSDKVVDLAGSLSSTKSDSLLSVASSDVRSDKGEPMDTAAEGQQATQDVCEQPLPIQVDGASDERISLVEDQLIAGSNQGEGLKPAYLTTADKDDVFREEGASLSLKSASEHHADKESDTSSDGSMKRIQQQLVGLCSMMDDDVTDSSSDEEEETPQITR